MADGALVADIVQRGIIQSRDGSQGTGNTFFVTGKMDETVATLAIDVLINVRLLNGAVQHRSVLLKQLTKRVFVD